MNMQALRHFVSLVSSTITLEDGFFFKPSLDSVDKTCDDDLRGSFRRTEGTTSVADKMEWCRKDGNDDYGWTPFDQAHQGTTMVEQTATISSGVVTLDGPHVGILTLDTEGAAATDDLVTISGGAYGQVIFVRQTNSGRDITFKHGTGAGGFFIGQDFTPGTSQGGILLFSRGPDQVWLKLAEGVTVEAAQEIVRLGATQTLTNKTLTTPTLQDDSDPTKQARFQLSGISSGQTRVYTLFNGNSTLVGDVNTQTLSNKTLTTPTIASFTNAQHNHTNAAGGGQITRAAVSNFAHIHGVVQRSNSVSVSVNSAEAVTVSCESGEVMVGGGGGFTQTVTAQMGVVRLRPTGANTWEAVAWNGASGASRTLEVYALCLNNTIS